MSPNALRSRRRETRLFSLTFGLLAAPLINACGGERTSAAPPPSMAFDGGGASETGGSGSPPDGGEDETTAPLTRCDNLVAASEPGEGVINNSVQSPTDFSVSRVERGYLDTCSSPAVVVRLSDGRCPSGKGHELAFEFDAGAIARGELPNGELDVLTARADGLLSIIYERPVSGGTPGKFGTCNVATGTLALAELPSLARGAVYEGSYQLSLSPCAGTAGAAQAVVGTFSASLSTSLSTHCPDFAP